MSLQVTHLFQIHAKINK